ncbi:efflux RND transporter periplasmic adaptor subunit [Pseudoxanthobacter sp.]|uniref:efflux RND transporter periplasmic adaptor subunit n=1 Tax=Pseudoxanthobacter sp. TaxID=1925742 RepID=UPI002FDF5AD9
MIRPVPTRPRPARSACVAGLTLALLLPAARPAPAQPAAAPAAPRPPAVSVMKAEPGTLTERVVVTGDIVPREEVQVSAEIDGQAVTEVLAEAGDRVEKGAVLARLSRETLDAALAQAEAHVARADAAISQAESQVTEAGATLEQARKVFARTDQLAKTGVASREAYDQRKSDVDVGAARLAAAEQALKAARADKALAVAQQRDAGIRLERTEIRAPAAGVISRRDVRVGQVVSSASGPLFRIIENGDLDLSGEVAEAVIVRLAVGDAAAVTPSGFAGPIAGTVRRISPEVNDRSRLGEVRIALPQAPGLKVGAFARGEIETASRQGIVLPISAVLYGPRGPQVQVVNGGGVVETRPVTIALVAEGRAVVTAGLKAGDTIVSISGTFLRNGDRVTPILRAGSGTN